MNRPPVPAGTPIPGFWIVPCQYGEIYPYGGQQLCVLVKSAKVANEMRSWPELSLLQDTDDAVVFRFDVGVFEKVAERVGAKKRRQASTVTMKKIGTNTAYRAPNEVKFQRSQPETSQETGKPMKPDIATLKVGVTIENVLDDFGITHRHNRAACPVHKGDNRSAFSFNDDTFCCHTRGCKGDVVTLIMALAETDIHGAIEYLSRKKESLIRRMHTAAGVRNRNLSRSGSHRRRTQSENGSKPLRGCKVLDRRVSCTQREVQGKADSRGRLLDRCTLAGLAPGRTRLRKESIRL